MTLTDPGNHSVTLNYEPFGDAAGLGAFVPQEPAMKHHKTIDRDLSASPQTPPTLEGASHFKRNVNGWEHFHGPIYCNVQSQYEGLLGKSDNHYDAAAPKPMVAEPPHSIAATPTTGTMQNKYEPRTHAINGHYDPLTVCADCTAHQRAAAMHLNMEHRADAIHQLSNHMVEKLGALEKELEVKFVHIVHEGTSWIRRGHHHGDGPWEEDKLRNSDNEKKDMQPLQRDFGCHDQ